jgi:hypothetical protein
MLVFHGEHAVKRPRLQELTLIEIPHGGGTGR